MEIPEIPEGEIDRIINEDPVFLDALSSYDELNQNGYQPELIDEKAIDEHALELESRGETAIDILVDGMIQTAGLPPPFEPPSTAINDVFNQVDVSESSVQTMNDVIEGKTPTVDQISAIQTEAATQTDRAVQEIQNQTPDQQNSSLALDQLARDTVENAATKDVPLEGTWNDIFKKLAKYFIDVLKLGTALGLGFYLLKLLSKSMTGCYQYYFEDNKPKCKKLVCDGYTYDDKKGFCNCLSSQEVNDCQEAIPLFDESSDYNTLKKTCDLAWNSSDHCIYKNELFKNNPICTLAEGKCFDVDPRVCDLKTRTVYYSYQKYDWASLLSNIIHNWPELYKGPVNAVENLIKFIIYSVVVIVGIIIIYNVSKLVFRRLNYRVDNTQMKKLSGLKVQSQKKLLKRKN